MAQLLMSDYADAAKFIEAAAQISKISDMIASLPTGGATILLDFGAASTWEISTLELRLT